MSVRLIMVQFLSCLIGLANPARAQPTMGVDLIWHNQSGDSTYTVDSNEFKFFYPENHPELQTLLDEVTVAIMQTPTGKQLCSWLLHNDSKEIEYQLGVSRRAGIDIAMGCHQVANLSITPPDYIFANFQRMMSGPQPGVNKLTWLPTQKRIYAFVVTSAEKLAMDSWTEPLSGRTTIFIPTTNIRSQQELKTYLVRVLAHELAIYYDSKAIPFGTEWEQVVKNFGYDWQSLSNDTRMALLNPVIAAPLAMLRAYKIENKIFQEMNLPQVANGDVERSYSECMSQGIETCLYIQILPFSDMTVPLLALAPQYRKLFQSSRIWSEQPEASRFIESVPLQYLAQYTMGNQTLSLLQQALYVDDHMPEDWRDTRDFFFHYVMSVDWRQLSANPESKALLQFMAEPLLSTSNIHFSGGPRARIRVGRVR